jgi:bifunctional DNase/RNase
MQKDVVEVEIRGVMPTSNGCAIFLGPEEKTFVIYVDQSIGSVIQMAINEAHRERPMTHDLILSLLKGLGATLERVIINDVDDGTFFARIIVKMENEVATKLIELDARPSDSMALALQSRRPILVARKVLESVEDMTEILEKILKQQG